MKPMHELAERLLKEIADATRDTQGITRECFGAGEETALLLLAKQACGSACPTTTEQGHVR